MIATITTISAIGSNNRHKTAVAKQLKNFESYGYHVTEVRRVQRGWWGLWADEDITQITYRKGN